MDMLTQLENSVLNRESTQFDDSDFEIDMPVAPTKKKRTTPAQLFSSPRRRHKSKIRDNEWVPRVKKPRRRVRKENGGYDLSPTATRDDSSR
jgi:hypothetical protein